MIDFDYGVIINKLLFFTTAGVKFYRNVVWWAVVVAICSPQCMNGGQCVSPNFCLCLPGTHGTACEKCTSALLAAISKQSFFSEYCGIEIGILQCIGFLYNLHVRVPLVNFHLLSCRPTV